MKAITYRWSGNTKTVIDVGDEWPLVYDAISLLQTYIKKQISNNDMFYDKYVHELEVCNNILNALDQLEEYTDQVEACKAVAELILPKQYFNKLLEEGEA